MDLGPATADELEEFNRVVMAAFHRDADDDVLDRWRPVFEVGRALAWRDGGRIVATAWMAGRELTVPGGRTVPCAAVTGVGVLSTHRRRGLLTGMMHRQLEELRDGGEPVAALWSSEASIYRRFGYEAATEAASLRARRPAARLAVPVPREPALAAGPAGEHLDAMRQIHDCVRHTRPGMLDRAGAWWEHRLADPERDRNGAQSLQAVVTDGGYALYAVRPKMDEDSINVAEVDVRELVAQTPEARATLWAFLLDQDLTATVTWPLAPADEPLALMLADPRAVRRGVGDALWVRVVDLPRALGARGYAQDADVVFELADEVCPWNAGRWRLAGGRCEKTDDRADLAFGAAELAAAYLGGTTLAQLAAAGRVRELHPGALARASAALRGDAAPWCPEIF